MAKIIRIEKFCQECQFYDNLYGECQHDGEGFQRRIADYTCQPDVFIPLWCPLPDAPADEVEDSPSLCG